MKNINVKPEKTSIRNLLKKIEEGKIRIPLFQRDFVWDSKQMLELFDSIEKGYPIGSLLLWKPEEAFETFDKIGPFNFNYSDSKDISYVLDGFQRITTLFGVLSNPKYLDFDEKELKKYSICLNLNDLENQEIRFQFNSKTPQIDLIPLFKIVDTYEYLDYMDAIRAEISDKMLSRKFIDKCQYITKIFYDYEIPYIEIIGGDIESAVEIFSRVNSSGTTISKDFMLSALSYNKESKFLLSEKITEFQNSLAPYNFEKLDREVILNCIISSRGKIYFDTKTEELIKNITDIEPLTHNAFPHILKAIEFLYKKLNVLDVKYLPYPAQLIFISEFFRLNGKMNEVDINEKLNGIKDWFWWTSYTNSFSESITFQRKLYDGLISITTAISHDFDDFTKNLYEKFGYNNKALKGLYPDKGGKINTKSFPEKLAFTGVRSKILQLFMIKTSCGNKEILFEDKIIEKFVFVKWRRVGNMLFLLNSEFKYNNLDYFIKNASDEILERHFITPEIKEHYLKDETGKFIVEREELIMKKEKEFVESLGISYTEE